MRGRTTWALHATLAMLAVATSAYFVIVALGPAQPDMRRTAVLSSIALTDDDGGRALFPNNVLIPGKAVSRCVRIAYAGSTAADAPGVRLAARSLRGALVPRLTVLVELGNGGGFTGCGAFEGHGVYGGRLGTLSTAEGVPTGWVPLPGEARTYRITVALDADAGLSSDGAQATLQWIATASGGPEPTEPPVSRTPSPFPVRVQPAGVPATESARPSPPMTASGAMPCTAPPAPTWPVRLRTGAKRAMQDFVKVAGRAGRDSAFPLLALLLFLMFLLVQRHIDRRDPKLALAPLSGQRYAYIPAVGEPDVVVRPPPLPDAQADPPVVGPPVAGSTVAGPPLADPQGAGPAGAGPTGAGPDGEGPAVDTSDPNGTDVDDPEIEEEDGYGHA